MGQKTHEITVECGSRGVLFHIGNRFPHVFRMHHPAVLVQRTRQKHVFMEEEEIRSLRTEIVHRFAGDFFLFLFRKQFKNLFCKFGMCCSCRHFVILLPVGPDA